MFTALHTTLAVEKHLAERKFLQLKKNVAVFLNLQKGPEYTQ